MLNNASGVQIQEVVVMIACFSLQQQFLLPVAQLDSMIKRLERAFDGDAALDNPLIELRGIDHFCDVRQRQGRKVQYGVQFWGFRLQVEIGR